MSKDEIAEILEQIARLLELKGENPFKIRAYANAARALETLSGDRRDDRGRSSRDVWHRKAIAGESPPHSDGNSNTTKAS
jgi:hypothetical protein